MYPHVGCLITPSGRKSQVILKVDKFIITSGQDIAFDVRTVPSTISLREAVECTRSERWHQNVLGHSSLSPAPRARHKGKVEKGIDYVQSNALKARRFTRLEEQNAFLLDWELTVADTRIHGTTRRQVGKHFTDVERAALLPLPLTPFPSFHEGRRTVHRDGHVEVKRALLCGATGVLGARGLGAVGQPPGADFQ